MVTDMNQAAKPNDDFFENSFETEIAAIAGVLVHTLYRCRVLQHRLDLTDEDTQEKRILADATTKIRAALGRPDYYGILDLLGTQLKEQWPDGATKAGEYVISSPQGEERSFTIYRFDTDNGALYSMPELTYRSFSLWHTTHEAVIMQLSASLGVPPGGRYIITPDSALGRA